MKTKSNKSTPTNRKVLLNYPVPHEFDLFGESSVTISEVVLWVESLTIYDRHSPRFDWYVKNWAVVDKIKHVKQKHYSLEAYFTQQAANDSRY